MPASKRCSRRSLDRRIAIGSHRSEWPQTTVGQPPVELLLELGADPTAGDGEGRTVADLTEDEAIGRMLQEAAAPTLVRQATWTGGYH